jgi:energy-coupling factor transporter ATP-binding protein EcfA2
VLRISNLTLARGTRRLLEGANLTVHARHKVGLVGANGGGKSSLFAAIRRELLPDAGSIDLPASWTIAHVAQETPPVEQGAIEYVLDGDPELREIEAGLASADTDGAALADLHHRYEVIGGYGARARAAILLAGLGFDESRHRESGGELLGRVAHALESRPGAAVALRSPAARRADEPPRPRRGAVARGLARQVSRHAAPHHARPRLSSTASWTPSCTSTTAGSSRTPATTRSSR